MTAEAEVSDALECEHVPVGASVDLMTGGASLDPGGLMLIKVRPFFVCMAFEAGFVLETAQTLSCGWYMRVVARCAVHDAFLKSVAFVELELGKHLVVAYITGFGGTDFEERGIRFRSMDSMTRGAVHGSFAVRTCKIS